MTMLDSALAWWRAGCAPIPLATSGTKKPAVNWGDFVPDGPTEDEVRTLFGTVDTDGIAIICGTPSGGLEMVELEARAVKEGMLQRLGQTMADNGLAELWQRLHTGYVEASPSGGVHFHLRVTDGVALGNTKLARRPSTPEELADHPGQRVQVLIETRGEGGYTVVSPSGGRTHPTGGSWVVVAGTPETIPGCTVEERDALYAICCLLDDMPVPQSQPIPSVGPTDRPGGTGQRPGDQFNAETTWDELLVPDGWTRMHQHGTVVAWCRPGKKPRDGMSATTGRRSGAEDCLYVFSSSVDLPTEEPITKFRYYALTRHNGDNSAAASALAKDGYGDPPPLERHLTLIRSEEPCDSPAAPEAAVAPSSTDTYGTPSVPGLSAIPAPTPAGSTTPATSLSSSAGPTAQQAQAIATRPRTVPVGILASLTDKGNADLVVAEHATAIHYVPSRKAWIAWDGLRWKLSDDTAPAIQAAQASIMSIDPGGDKEVAKHKAKSLSRRSLEAAVALASTHPAMRIDADLLDADPWALNTPGGLVDLRTGQTRPPRPDDWCTKMTASHLDRSAPTPRWDAFLDDTFGGDTEMVQFVQRLAGMSIIGQVRQHVLPFLHGGGANGKSVLLDVIVHVLGDYATTAPSDFLMAGRADESAIARLSGMRLVVCSEVSQSARFDEAKVKLLTGGDRITSRFLYGQYFTFAPTHHLWLMGNHQPRVEAGGTSFWRRLRLVPFERTVPVDQRVEDLASQLVADEAPGILAWIIEGAIEVQRRGLAEPESVMAATRAYAAEEDALGRFVADRVHLGGGDMVRVNTAEVRHAYVQWCRDNGEAEVPPQTFGRELRSRWGIQTVRSHGSRFYAGMTLLADEMEEEEPEERWDQR
ncbi:hypothetical protein GCM10009785_01380 [Brooklawnia cerclae]|uniref:P4 family phage/plasmid primase-like protein n=1 Tax=Brooklawnia cerclae TaxID=349934 RepID=A0ABX0SD04_9ACTN|nr:phage/plasmid primase, P4 family [Brooklawnia cerclae]NIH56267.1 P4 family phage/plasmid primase-like protein [Brooklawnia cerclae]